MKMYILIPDDVPDNFVPVSAAHASLKCFTEFQGDVGMSCWHEQSFRKVVCKATHTQIEQCRKQGKWVSITESNLDGMLVAVAFCPRIKWNDEIKRLPLWSPTVPTMEFKPDTTTEF